MAGIASPADSPASAPAPAAPSALTRAGLARIFLPHLASLFLPLVSLGFLLTAPHRWWVAILAVAVPALAMQLADRYSGKQLHEPRADLPGAPFDALLVVLVAVQLLNVALLVWVFSPQSLWSVDAVVAAAVVGASSGYSGIVVAHELIHRQRRGMQRWGRLLLCTVMYEHFYTEHVRGHHLRVGTPDDPATARFGESFNRFYVRTVPAQFQSAWRLETKRLGDEAMPLLDRRQLRNRVLHGVVAEWSLAFAILALFGTTSFALFLAQAVFASRALEVVNYFEHWGLVRTAKRVRPIDSWDTHSRFTYYALTGLTRHADHHAFAARPYEQLRVHPEAPVLPRGYIAMFPLVLGRNREFRRQMTEELKRRRLGPFADLELPETAAAPPAGALTAASAAS